MYEEGIVIGDLDKEEGLALVMKKTLLAPKQEEQEDWLRCNIFQTTCNIGGCPFTLLTYHASLLKTPTTA